MKTFSFATTCVFFVLIQLSKQDRNRTTLVFENEDEIIENLSKKLELAADAPSSTEDKFFKIGVTGGSLLRILPKALSKIKTDWSKWRFFFVEEELVPYDHPNSIYGAYKKAFAGLVNITDEQFVKANTSLEPREAAENYYLQMGDYFSVYESPRFDVILLGVRSDGYVYEVVPRPVYREYQEWISFPEDPNEPRRISFTFLAINNAKFIISIVTGQTNARKMQYVIEDMPEKEKQEDWIIGMVTPYNGELIWMLDKAAAFRISQ